MNTEKEVTGEIYDTSFGKAVIVSADRIYKMGDQIHINGHYYTVKQIILPTRPDIAERCTLIIEQN